MISRMRLTPTDAAFSRTNRLLVALAITSASVVLPGTRWPVEDDGCQGVGFDHPPKELAWCQQVRLPNDLIQSRRGESAMPAGRSRQLRILDLLAKDQPYGKCMGRRGARSSREARENGERLIFLYLLWNTSFANANIKGNADRSLGHFVSIRGRFGLFFRWAGVRAEMDPSLRSDQRLSLYVRVWIRPWDARSQGRGRRRGV